MKIFVIGGINRGNNELDTLNEFCKQLGIILGDSEHQIVLCSEHPGSADRALLAGIKESSGIKTDKKVIVHRPDDPLIRKNWKSLEKDNGLINPEYNSHKGPDFRGKDGKSVSSYEGLKLAFLLCQIQALNDCDVLISIGGKKDGSAILLLSIARQQSKIIIPYRFLGGAAEYAYNQLEGELKARIGKSLVEKLYDQQDGPSAILEILDRLQGVQPGSPPRIFLSYAWRSAEHADLIEAILRRFSNVTVFRDERDILQGESINQIIQEEIKAKCNIFIALWCSDYVKSPYCHDEMNLWIKHRRFEQLHLIRFDNTRPVWTALRDFPDNREEFRAKWPRVGKNRAEIEKILSDIIYAFNKA